MHSLLTPEKRDGHRVRRASVLFGRTPKSCVISFLRVAIGLLGRSAEYEVQAGREHHVVLFDAARRGAHVAIVERDLPAEPAIQLAVYIGIERCAVFTDGGDVGKDFKALAELRPLVKCMRECLPRKDLA